MKKLFAVLATFILVATLAACGKEEKGNFDYADGKYFAIEENFSGSGYKYFVTLELKNGKITSVKWDGYHIDGGAGSCKGNSKYECSKLGLYAMVAKGGSIAEWDVQADVVTKWLLDNQTTSVTYNTKAEVADQISSATIKSKAFFDLVNKALENGAVAKGQYEDGFYYFEATKEDKTVSYGKKLADGTDLGTVTDPAFKYYTFATFIVVNGTIKVADFNAAHDAYEYVVDANGKFVKVPNPNDATKTVNVILMVPKKDSAGNVIAGEYVAKKKYVSKDSAGNWYGMHQRIKTDGTATVEWNVQAAAVEAKLLADQTLTLGTGNKVDGVATATIHTEDFGTLFLQIPKA